MKHSPENWFRVALRLCIPVLIIGALFKIMHWPGANFLIIGAFTGMILFSILRFGVQKKRQGLDYIRVVLVTSFAVRGVLVILHWPGAWIPSVLFILSLILWVWYDGLASILNPGKTETTIRQKFSNTLLVMGGLSTISGIIFKMMHWPGGGVILVIGIAALAGSFFTGVLKDE